MHGRITCTAAAWLATAALALGQTPPPDAAYAPTTSMCSDSCAGRTRGFYANVDYLLFDFRDGPAPALIQHVPTNQVFIQPLPNNSAITVYGDGIRHHAFNGYRAEAGYWVSDQWAGEVSFFQFETKNKRFEIASDGEPSIGRHYQDVSNANNTNTYLIFANRPIRMSSARRAPAASSTPPAPCSCGAVKSTSRRRATPCSLIAATISSASLHRPARRHIHQRRHRTFHDGSGLSIFGTDRFYATNQFYGGQVGFNSYGEIGGGIHGRCDRQARHCGVQQQVAINGVTIETVNGVVTQTTPGHVLTQPSNIGTYSRTRFAFVPELILKLGYQFGEHCNVSLGYDIFTVTSVSAPVARSTKA